MPPKKKTDKSTKATAKTRGQAVAQSVRVNVRVGDTAAKKKRPRKRAPARQPQQQPSFIFAPPNIRYISMPTYQPDGWLPPQNVARNGAPLLQQPAVATIAPRPAAVPTLVANTPMPDTEPEDVAVETPAPPSRAFLAPSPPPKKNLIDEIQQKAMERQQRTITTEPPPSNYVETPSPFKKELLEQVIARGAKKERSTFAPLPEQTPMLAPTPEPPPVFAPSQTPSRNPKTISLVRENITSAFESLGILRDNNAKQALIKRALGSRYVEGKPPSKYTSLQDSEAILAVLRNEISNRTPQQPPENIAFAKSFTR